MGELLTNMGAVGAAVVIALLFIDKVLPHIRGANGGSGVSQVNIRQTEILVGIQESQVEMNKALAKLVWIAEEESKYYRTRNGK